MEKDKNFWFGKRVLITGGDGFVASHLIKSLINKGAVVVATVLYKKPISTLEIIRGKRHQIDTIFHLSASSIVSDAANSPFSAIENNVMGTVNILEIARINKIPRVLITSSDKSYGDHATDSLENIPYKENYALRGLDVYSASKACADVLAQTYSYQFKVPIIVARSCNIFGPGDLNFPRKMF